MAPDEPRVPAVSSLPEIDQGALVAVSAAFGAGATAIGRMISGNRRTDKVDAVAAVAAAFDRVAERTNAHVDDLAVQCRRLHEQVDYLNRELRKRDELILQHISGRRAAPTLTDESEQP